MPEAVAHCFQQSLAAFQMSNLTTSQDAAAFLVTYSSAGKNYSGPGAVVLKAGAAWWLSYGSPSAAYLARGAALVSGVGRSLSDGGEAAPPPASPSPSPDAASSLTGNWSSGNYFGELVNPSTGAFVQSSYSGEWYTFGTDGTYRYTIAGSGQIITGVVICTGTYEVSGGTVRLHQKTESWYPLPRDATGKPMLQGPPHPGGDYARH